MLSTNLKNFFNLVMLNINYFIISFQILRCGKGSYHYQDQYI